jgi:hypothetical protein
LDGTAEGNFGKGTEAGNVVWVVDAEVGEASELVEHFEASCEEAACSAFFDEEEKYGEDGHNDGSYVEDPPPKSTLCKLEFLLQFSYTCHPIVTAIYDPYMGPTRRPPVVAQAHM